MRRRRGRQWGIGRLCIIAGTLILLAMILPEQFWWFVLGISLISLGIWYGHC